MILQGHQIEQLLNSDEEDHAEPSNMTSPTPVEGLSEPPPGADGSDEFVDDDDWENLANTTLDGMEAEIVTSVTTSACDDHILSERNDSYFGSDTDTVIISLPSEDESTEKS